MTTAPLDSYLALLGGSVLTGWLVATVMTTALKKESEIQSKYGSSTTQMFVGLGAAIFALLSIALSSIISAVSSVGSNLIANYRIYLLLIVAAFIGVAVEEFQYPGMPILDKFSTTTTQPIYNEVFIPLGNTARLAYNVSYCWFDVLGATYRTAIEDTFYTTIQCDDVNWSQLVNRSLIAIELPFAEIAIFINAQGSEELNVRAMVTAIAQALNEFEPPLICFCENLSFLFNTFFVVINSPNLANAIHYLVNAAIAASEAIIGLLTALFNSGPPFLTCNVNRPPNLIPTVNYLTNSTVATFDLIDDITEALFVAFFGNIFCNSTQFPQVGPILSRPLTALLQFVQIQLQILFHIDLVFEPSCDYLQYIQPNYVFYEGYAWSYGIQVFFDDFCWDLTSDLGCALAGTVNVTLNIIQFVTLTGQVILVHPLTPIDTINFVRNYDIFAILNQTELATTCLANMVEVLNLPLGQVFQYVFLSLEQLIYIFLQLISNILDFDAYLTGKFGSDVNQFFIYLYAIAVAVGNCFRQFDLTTDGSGNLLCPLINPLNMTTIQTTTFNVACCFGNSIQAFGDIFISITDFIVILIIDVIDGRSFNQIYLLNHLNFRLEVIPSIDNWFEAIACIPSSIFAVVYTDGGCPKVPGLSVPFVFTQFGLSFGNLTTIPFDVLDSVFDTAYGLNYCNECSAASMCDYTACIASIILSVVVTAYDITLGQLFYLSFTFGDVLGCLMSGTLTDVATAMWGLFGWDGPCTTFAPPNICSIDFNLRDVLIKMVNTLTTIFTFFAKFFNDPLGWLLQELGQLAQDLENKVFYAFNCVEGFFNSLFTCIKSSADSVFGNLFECIGCLGICHQCSEISLSNCNIGGCTANLTLTPMLRSTMHSYQSNTIKTRYGRPISIGVPTQWKAGKRTVATSPSAPSYYLGHERGLPTLLDFESNSNKSIDVSAPCIDIFREATNMDYISPVRYTMLLTWEACVVSSTTAHLISSALVSKSQLLLSPYTFIHPMQIWSLVYNLTRLPFYIADELSQISTDPGFNITGFDPYNEAQVKQKLEKNETLPGLWLNGTYIRNWLDYATYYDIDPLCTRLGFFADSVIRSSISEDDLHNGTKSLLSSLIHLAFVGIKVNNALLGSQPGSIFNLARGAVNETSHANLKSAVSHVYNMYEVRNETKQMIYQMRNWTATTIQNAFMALTDPIKNPQPQAAENRRKLMNIVYFTVYAFSDTFSGKPRGYSYAKYIREQQQQRMYGYSMEEEQQEPYELVSTNNTYTPIHPHNRSDIEYLPYPDSTRAVKGFVKSNLNRHRGLMRHPQRAKIAEMGITVFEETFDDTQYCFDNTTCLNCSVLQTYVTDMVDIIAHCIVKSEFGVIANFVDFAATPALTLNTHNLDLSGWSTANVPIAPANGNIGRLILNFLSLLTFNKVNFVAVIQNFNNFFLNPNPNSSSSFLFWMQFIFICNIDQAMVCDPSRGLGLYPAIEVLTVTFIIVSVALTVLLPGSSVFIMALIFLCLFLVPVVAYEVGPRCLLPFPVPILPDCLVDDLFRVMMVFYADCFDWNRFFPGITTDACPTAAEGYTRVFANCQAAPYNFQDGLRSWFFLLDWQWPAAYTWLTTTNIGLIKSFTSLGFIAGDLSFPFPPGDPQPDTFIGCFILNIFQLIYPLAVLVVLGAAIFFFLLVLFALIWFILVALTVIALVVLDVVTGSQGLSNKMGETYPITSGDHTIKPTVTPANTSIPTKPTASSHPMRPPPPSYVARVTSQTTIQQQPLLQQYYAPATLNYGTRFLPTSSPISAYTPSYSDVQNPELRRRIIPQQSHPPSSFY